MEGSVKGDVVVVPFPFSDLSSSKKRPALVVANMKGDDMILCQITSQRRKDSYSVRVESKDMEDGNLKMTSMVRPNRLFTADKSIISYKIGSLRHAKIELIEDKIIDIIKN